MNKKFLGIKISSVLSVLLCFIFAVLFWLFVKYSEAGAASALKIIPRLLGV